MKQKPLSQEDNDETGIYISSLSQGAPALKSGKIRVWDKIVKVSVPEF